LLWAEEESARAHYSSLPTSPVKNTTAFLAGFLLVAEIDHSARERIFTPIG